MIQNSSQTQNPKPHGILHGLFDVVVILKGLNGLAEIASGITLFLLQTGAIVVWVNWLTQSELIQDPNDLFATLLRRWAISFGHDAQIFAGFYLLAHGIVKTLLSILLFMEKVWAFPLAMVLFPLLVAFSIHRLSLNWSWTLVGFVCFDLFTIWLIAREWRAVVRLKSAHTSLPMTERR